MRKLRKWIIEKITHQEESRREEKISICCFNVQFASWMFSTDTNKTNVHHCCFTNENELSLFGGHYLRKSFQLFLRRKCLTQNCNLVSRSRTTVMTVIKARYTRLVIPFHVSCLRFSVFQMCSTLWAALIETWKEWPFMMKKGDDMVVGMLQFS